MFNPYLINPAIAQAGMQQQGMGFQPVQATQSASPQSPAGDMMGQRDFAAQQALAEAMMQRGANAPPAQSNLEGLSNIGSQIAGALIARGAQRSEAKQQALGDQLISSAMAMDADSPKRDSALLSAAQRGGRDDIANALIERELNRTPAEWASMTSDEMAERGFAPGTAASRNNRTGQIDVHQQPPRPGRGSRRQSSRDANGILRWVDNGEPVPGFETPRSDRSGRATSEGGLRADIQARYLAGEPLNNRELEYLNAGQDEGAYGLDAAGGQADRYENAAVPSGWTPQEQNALSSDPERGVNRAYPVHSSADDVEAVLNGPLNLDELPDDAARQRAVDRLPPGSWVWFEGQMQRIN